MPDTTGTLPLFRALQGFFAVTIFFYSKTDPNFEYSNFARFGVEFEGQWWDTVEHYFQAQKFDDPEYRETIRKAATPKIAASLGRSRKVSLRGDWEDAKLDVMRRAVRKKFETHDSIREKLLSTGSEVIMEASPGDYFWGGGQDGSGENWLGRILMEVRDELRQVT